MPRAAPKSAGPCFFEKWIKTATAKYNNKHAVARAPKPGSQIPAMIPSPPAISRKARTGTWFGFTPTFAIAAITSGTFFNFEIAEPIAAKDKRDPKMINEIFIR